MKLLAALLLALLLPLQNMALANCAPNQATGAQCPDHPKQGMGDLHHHCGVCCCVVAAAIAPLRWDTPRPAGPRAWLPTPKAPHRPALDRLDRPPRLQPS